MIIPQREIHTTKNTKLTKLVFWGYVQCTIMLKACMIYMSRVKSHKIACFYEKYTRIVPLQFINYGLCFVRELEKPIEFDNWIAVTDLSKITVHIPAGWKSQLSC